MNRALTVTCASLGFTAFIAGCVEREPTFVGVDAASGLEVSLRPTPPDRNFSGEYRSPHLGELHLEQHGSALLGRYHYEADGRSVAGSLHGRVRANLAEVEWEEHDVVGPDRSRLGGFGFFLYDAPRAEDAPRANAEVSPSERRPARLFGQRRVATRLFPTPTDEHYGWLNVSRRDEPWTAVEIVPRGPSP
jgi:hypothetical protein